MNILFIRLSSKFKNLAFFVALVLSFLIYNIDKNILGNDITLILPYLFIITFTILMIGDKSGLFFTILSLLLWALSAEIFKKQSLYSACINFSIKGSFLLLHFYTIRYIKILYEKIQTLSLTDQLTGLLNRRGFHILAENSIDTSMQLGNFIILVFIDIDNFKIINDTMGHEEGDKVLKSLANVLEEFTHKSDIKARLGGDEFCILLSNKENSEAEALVRGIVKNFATQSKRNSWVTTLSIGMLTVEKLESLNSLIQKADKLMYESKKKGKNQITSLTV